MTDPADQPQPDQTPGAPHPREAAQLFGHDAAEAAFLDAFKAGRLHHGWLIAGPQGVGKATLAWRIARFLLAQPRGDPGMFAAAPPTSLDVPAADPAHALVAAGAHPGLLVIRRGYDLKRKRLRQVITVEETRRLHRFFGTHATEGGWRVVIVDAADEMNVNAANALLKALEEPPARALLLLVAHRPSALLPTIRSRCRMLPLAPLHPADMAGALAQAGFDPGEDAAAVAALSGGSVGAAVRLMAEDGVKLYAEVNAVLGAAPRIDRARLLRLARDNAGRDGDGRFELLVRLIEMWLARLARSGVTGPSTPEAAKGEADTLARLSPDPRAARAWAEAAATLLPRVRQGRALNLDPAGLVLDTGLKIEGVAQGILRQTA